MPMQLECVRVSGPFSLRFCICGRILIRAGLRIVATPMLADRPTYENRNFVCLYTGRTSI